MTANPTQRRIVVFDIGGVLLRWDPRHLYRKLFPGDERAMEDFLTNVCTVEWNERQDAGRTFAEAHADLLPRHADKTHLIEAFGKRFDEMIAGPIEGTVDILADLQRAGVPRYALLERYRIAPDEVVFIDDNPGNAAAAHALGIHGIHFRSPELLRRELEALGVL